MNLETHPAKFTWSEKVQIKPMGPYCAFQSFHLTFFLQQSLPTPVAQGPDTKSPKENASVQSFSCHLAHSWPGTHTLTSPPGPSSLEGQAAASCAGSRGQAGISPSIGYKQAWSHSSLSCPANIFTWNIKHSQLKQPHKTNTQTNKKAKPISSSTKFYFRDTMCLFKCKE